jgi:hypothetical protein
MRFITQADTTWKVIFCLFYFEAQGAGAPKMVLSSGNKTTHETADALESKSAGYGDGIDSARNVS